MIYGSEKDNTWKNHRQEGRKLKVKGQSVTENKVPVFWVVESKNRCKPTAYTAAPSQLGTLFTTPIFRQLVLMIFVIWLELCSTYLSEKSELIN